MTLTVKDALEQAKLLSSDSARLDAEMLLAHALQKTRTWLYTWPESELSPEQAQRFAGYMQRRQAGEPVAYITGRRAFWNFELQVNAAVLIPRPETELLVDMALSLLRQQPSARLADLGTGSGAIALALASERPDSLVIAVEQSEQALAVARANADELGLRNIEFRQGSWCAPLAGESLHMIVSNPPYIAEADPHLERGDLRFEPPAALVAPGDGLDDIVAICRQARHCLLSGGVLILEHGYNQAAAVRSILQREGYCDVESRQDLAGHERITRAVWNTEEERPDA